jgi:hypothetical protein
MADRLTLLKQFYNENPDDPFNIYGLALEYLKSDRIESMKLFDVLLHRHEGYIPTYYHAAKLALDLGDRERAEKIYEKGMEMAKIMNDAKAFRELRSAYDELMFE